MNESGVEAEGSPLRAGFARVDVTPPVAPVGVPYLSYYPRQTPFEGVHDRLYARAVALELGGTRAAIVAVDSLGISRSVAGEGRDYIEEIRTRVERATGIPAGHVLLSATHAHSTPQTTDLTPFVELYPPGAAWLEQLADQLAASAAAAWAGRRPAHVRGATGLAPGIAWNRRILTTDGRLVRLQQRPSDDQVVKEPRDDRVPALLLSDATVPAGHSAHWRGALFGFTCHPTTVQVQPLVSADYPGVACEVVERALGVEAALFLQGACGNVGPVRATTDFQDVALYGRSLGGEAVRVLALLEGRDVEAMRPALAVASETLRLERRAVPDAAPLAAEAARLEERIRSAPDEAARREAIGAYRRVAEPLRLARLGSGPVRLELQAVRLGEAVILACEGELFVEYGNRIKEASPAAVTFVAAYANGYEGYIPTPEAWEEGGYEPSVGPWTRVAPTAGEVLAERALALVRDVWQQGEDQKR